MPKSRFSKSIGVNLCERDGVQTNHRVRIATSADMEAIPDFSSDLDEKSFVVRESEGEVN